VEDVVQVVSEEKAPFAAAVAPVEDLPLFFS
jgi:hypothetical protein